MAQVAGSKPVSVSCANHHDVLVAGLWKLLQNNKLTDINYYCGRQAIHAHKVVVESFVSQHRLIESYKGRKRGEFDDGGIHYEQLLEFMYTGQVIVPEDHLLDLLAVAKDTKFLMLVESVELCIATISKKQTQPIAHSRDLDSMVSPEDEDSAENMDSLLLLANAVEWKRQNDVEQVLLTDEVVTSPNVPEVVTAEPKIVVLAKQPAVSESCVQHSNLLSLESNNSVSTNSQVETFVEIDNVAEICPLNNEGESQLQINESESQLQINEGESQLQINEGESQLQIIEAESQLQINEAGGKKSPRQSAVDLPDNSKIVTNRIKSIGKTLGVVLILPSSQRKLKAPAFFANKNCKDIPAGGFHQHTPVKVTVSKSPDCSPNKNDNGTSSQLDISVDSNNALTETMQPPPVIVVRGQESPTKKPGDSAITIPHSVIEMELETVNDSDVDKVNERVATTPTVPAEELQPYQIVMPVTQNSDDVMPLSSSLMNNSATESLNSSSGSLSPDRSCKPQVNKPDEHCLSAVAAHCDVQLDNENSQVKGTEPVIHVTEEVEANKMSLITYEADSRNSELTNEDTVTEMSSEAINAESQLVNKEINTTECGKSRIHSVSNSPKSANRNAGDHSMLAADVVGAQTLMTTTTNESSETGHLHMDEDLRAVVGESDPCEFPMMVHDEIVVGSCEEVGECLATEGTYHIEYQSAVDVLQPLDMDYTDSHEMHNDNHEMPEESNQPTNKCETVGVTVDIPVDNVAVKTILCCSPPEVDTARFDERSTHCESVDQQAPAGNDINVDAAVTFAPLILPKAKAKVAANINRCKRRISRKRLTRKPKDKVCSAKSKSNNKIVANEKLLADNVTEKKSAGNVNDKELVRQQPKELRGMKRSRAGISSRLHALKLSIPNKKPESTSELSLMNGKRTIVKNELIVNVNEKKSASNVNDKELANNQPTKLGRMKKGRAAISSRLHAPELPTRNIKPESTSALSLMNVNRSRKRGCVPACDASVLVEVCMETPKSERRILRTRRSAPTRQILQLASQSRANKESELQRTLRYQVKSGGTVTRVASSAVEDVENKNIRLSNFQPKNLRVQMATIESKKSSTNNEKPSNTSSLIIRSPIFKQKGRKSKPAAVAKLQQRRADLSSAKTSLTSHCCPLCEKSFATDFSLNRHARTHTGVKRYKCKVCLKMFSELHHLNNHSRVHTGERPFSCRVCGKSFGQQPTALQHELTMHSTIRAHKCTICKKKFARRHVLTRHMLTHSHTKPYLCEICDKAFTQRVHLIDHFRTHTGEKPYHCHACGKSYTQLHSLRAHNC